MSIIYDALQKTQQRRQLKNDVAQEKLVKMKRKLFSWRIASLAVMVLICILLAISLILQNKKKSPLPTPVKQAVIKPLPPKPKLILNGVFISDQYTMAMINNKSYVLGDVVSGMKIVSIKYEGVQLKNNKHELLLR